MQPFICVWEQSVSHLGEVGGAELFIFEREAEDGPPIYSRTFVRPLSRIDAIERRQHEAHGMTDARRLLALAGSLRP